MVMALASNASKDEGRLKGEWSKSASFAQKKSWSHWNMAENFKNFIFWRATSTTLRGSTQTLAGGNCSITHRSLGCRVCRAVGPPRADGIGPKASIACDEIWIGPRQLEKVEQHSTLYAHRPGLCSGSQSSMPPFSRYYGKIRA